MRRVTSPPPPSLSADDLEFAFQKSRLAAAPAAPPPHVLVPISDSLVADVCFSTQCTIFRVCVAATGQQMCVAPPSTPPPST